MKTEFVLPGEIEKRSFEIIAAELKERNIKLDNKLAPVICRAIHTTADFDYAHTLVFSEGALDKLKELIKSGAAIVTDTNMALSGINKKTLAVFGCEASWQRSRRQRVRPLVWRLLHLGISQPYLW